LPADNIRIDIAVQGVMFMKILSVLLFTIPMVTSVAQAQFAGGSGTEADPYEVATLEQLQLIADTLYLDKHFIQIADIDAGETATWHDGLGFDPIGWMAFERDSLWIDIIGEPFTGTYNGNGFIIKDLTINREDSEFIGLFGYVEKGVIKNMTLENVHVTGLSSVGGLVGRNLGFIENAIIEGFVTGKGRTVGGLVGSNANNRGLVDTQEWIRGEISSSSASGQVSGAYHVGGLAGWNAGSISGSNATSDVSGKNEIGGISGVNGATITASFATGSVTGESMVGGLIGLNAGQAGRIYPFEGIVRDAYATGNVSGINNVGGLIGRSYRGEVHHTHATGRIISEDGSAGGLIANSTGCSIYSSYATGDVSGERFVGGLTGNSLGVNLESSFSEGSVSGTKWVGGLTGTGSGIISNTYARGNVSGDSLVGGLMGNISGGEISTSYATGDVSGRYHAGGLVGRMHYDRGAVIHKSYWDHEATNRFEAVGNTETDGATGLSTEQMTGQKAWVFIREFDFEQTWQLTEGYPVLAWQERDDSVEVPEAAIITVSERELDFGIVATGDTATHEFMIVNKGNTTLKAEIALPVPTEDHDMVFSIIAGEGTYQLEPGSTHSVEIGFNPKAVRDYTELMLIMHDAQNEDAVLEIQLAGSGKEGTSAEEEKAHKPDRVLLHQNYPNPFNPSTRIRYSLPEPAHVTVAVFDITGRHVATLVDGLMPAGEHGMDFDAGGLSSGIYVYRIQAGDVVRTRRMSLVK
jgi:hypothetical protein